MARRPFGSQEALQAAARDEWFALQPGDWLEAFAQHPRIGKHEAAGAPSGAARRLSAREQAGVDGAPGEVLAGLAEGNRQYEERFGYIFIIFASGRSAGDMLASLRARLANDADAEIRIAAGEQAKITARRLDTLTCGAIG